MISGKQASNLDLICCCLKISEKTPCLSFGWRLEHASKSLANWLWAVSFWTRVNTPKNEQNNPKTTSWDVHNPIVGAAEAAAQVSKRHHIGQRATGETDLMLTADVSGWLWETCLSPLLASSGVHLGMDRKGWTPKIPAIFRGFTRVPGFWHVLTHHLISLVFSLHQFVNGKPASNTVSPTEGSRLVSFDDFGRCRVH